MESEIPEELQEANEKFNLAQNRVNLLLVRSYKLRKENKEFTHQLKEIQSLTAMIEANKVDGNRPNRAVLSQDTFLRDFIRNNSLKIKELERRIEAQEVIEKMEKVNNVHERFRKVLNGDLEKKTRETLSSLKGRVEQLRKKSKELMKDIQTLEDAQKSYIDEQSMQNEVLREQNEKIFRLREEIRQKKEIARG